jgi:integrase
MTSHSETNRDTKTCTLKNKNDNLSPCGNWRSFPQQPNLIQYVPSETFYARTKVGGKVIRRSLNTDTFTTARLRMLDFLKAQRQSTPARGEPITFSQACNAYKADLTQDHGLSENHKRYQRFCVKQIQTTWPGVDALKLEKITPADCEKWASKLAGEVSAQYFNNTLGTFRQIFEKGIRLHLEQGGSRFECPAVDIKRLGVKQTPPRLPEQKEFETILELVGSAGARESKNCVIFIKFLTFSGLRVSEANQVTWKDIDFEKNRILVHSAKGRKTANHSDTRFVPILAPMKELLLELKLSNPALDDTICKVGDCEKSLTNACKKAGIARITHHDLRHLFATRCIESGVDIPTVSRWLGHKDGGALAMRIYGHLRDNHSQEMAAKVTFGGVK